MRLGLRRELFYFPKVASLEPLANSVVFFSGRHTNPTAGERNCSEPWLESHHPRLLQGLLSRLKDELDGFAHWRRVLTQHWVNKIMFSDLCLWFYLEVT